MLETGKAKKEFIYPHDAEDHYQTLLKNTEMYRTIPPHNVNGYSGPWIENLFIELFMDKPLTYFNGLIPIFVQWADVRAFQAIEGTQASLQYEKLMNHTIPSWGTYHTEISKLLRTDCLYVTVSQDAQGIFELSRLNPNILILSSGGNGHIPIPLLKSVLPYVPYPKTMSAFKYIVGFHGTNRKSKRGVSQMVMPALKMALDRALVRCKFGASEQWQQDMANTKYNLCPRGFGRTSYRLAETIQIGRIPVYLYDNHDGDVPWIPYQGTNISVENFGYILPYSFSNTLSSWIVYWNRNEEDIIQRLERIKQVREHYTYDGVLKQIHLFFSDPLGPHGGQLRCVTVPKTDT